MRIGSFCKLEFLEGGRGNGGGGEFMGLLAAKFIVIVVYTMFI